MTERDDLVKNLVHYLNQTYSSDKFIQEWQKDYETRFLVPKKPVFKRTRSVIKTELKERLQQSYSEDYRDNKDAPKLSFDTAEKCVEGIKILDHWIKGNKRNILYFSALQGQAIDAIKSLRKGNTGVFLVQQGIPFSVSYCNSLIRLYKLVKDHPKLQNCSIEVGIVLKNMKVMRDICKELGY